MVQEMGGGLTETNRLRGYDRISARGRIPLGRIPADFLTEKEAVTVDRKRIGGILDGLSASVVDVAEQVCFQQEEER
jgi:hypothetical protein